MIKRLQRNFILIAAVSVAAVMTVLLLGINAANIYQMNREADELLTVLSDNQGHFPEMRHNPKEELNEFPSAPAPLEEFGPQGSLRPQQDNRQDKIMRPFGSVLSEETRFKTRYFTVLYKADETVLVNVDNVAAVQEDGALAYADKVRRSGGVKGYLDNYRYCVTSFNGDMLYIFLDCTDSLRNVKTFAVFSLAVGLVCLIVVTALVTIFSRRAILPVVENMERQKRFITDAGHEIKTPLAIIRADAEVLEMTAGESEWTVSIRNQVERLTELVKNLLALAKMDETVKYITLSNVDFSETVGGTAASFLPVIQSRGLALSTDIEEQLHVQGDKASLEQLVNILMDNAVKYAKTSTKIELSLKAAGKKVLLSIYNVCDETPQGDLNRLFDRFYRADESRSRKTGGYGIGLSLAQAIVTAHKGDISAAAQQDGICFTVVLRKNEYK